MFYQVGLIDHCTHIIVRVAQYRAESYYNAECTSVVDLAHFVMLNNELMNKDPNGVPDEAPLNILDSKSLMCIANNINDTKNTRYIAIIIHFLLNGEECNMHKTVWCEGGLKLADIVTKNGREDKLIPGLGYNMVRLENW